MSEIRVLVLGSRGMLGQALVDSAPRHVTIQADAGDGAAYLDITDHTRIADVLNRVEPHWVINAAAYTHVDRAEVEKDRAIAVNALAVGCLGAACAARGIRLAHFSTDYVFSGATSVPYREEDATAPINAYGLSKCMGEQALARSGASSLVVRTQWLFGTGGSSFPYAMWQRALARKRTRVVNDQIGRPTAACDVARWTWKLIEIGADGVYHAANRGTASWFDVAHRVFARAGAPECVTACSTAEYPTVARRPGYSVLDTCKLEATLGVPVRTWSAALDEFLNETTSV